jgi:prepilin signal peptidase PulO-like enzyme (type II secretory pathway)
MTPEIKRIEQIKAIDFVLFLALVATIGWLYGFGAFFLAAAASAFFAAGSVEAKKLERLREDYTRRRPN